MPRSRTKMVKQLGDSMPPESQVGKIKKFPKSNKGPKQRRVGSPPLKKPSVKDVENLDTASLGELTRLYEEEIKKRGGTFTTRARLLRAAMNKAEAAEGTLLTQAQQMDVTEKAVKRRVPMSDRIRRKIVDVVEANLDSNVPKFQLRAAAIGAGLIKIEQSDEHHAAGEKQQNHLHVHATMADMRQQVQADSEYQDYLRRKGMTNGQTPVSSDSRIGDGGPIDVESTTHDRNGTGAENGHASPVCAAGEQRTLADAAAPGLPGPSHNGHHPKRRPLVG
jgi:hypothetical protein